MCGIAGVSTLDGLAPDLGRLETMRSVLTHRGPDGDGRYLYGGVGMVHTRLAIIDLDTGNQPFKDGAGSVLVANGEIYNYRELREELGEELFTTRSDCEPPLHLYRRDGGAFAARLRGMYAIALNDELGGELFLSRDPFGIKPLYYAEAADGLWFASEPQALIAADVVVADVDEDARAAFLHHQYSPGAETAFRGINRVLPGETLVIRAGRIERRERRRAVPASGPVKISNDAALEQLDQLFEESVELHQRADVPYGMFLSGGIDSSALIAMMKRLNDTPVQAFTAAFPDTNAADERAAARAVAEAVGADHTEIEVTEQDFWSVLPDIAAIMDDPAADYATIPTFLLARAAHAVGLKVVLSGEGGDELFGGYGRYRKRLWGGRRGQTGRPRSPFDRLGVLRDGVSGHVEPEASVRLRGQTGLQRAQSADITGWLPNDLLIKLDRCLMAHGVEGRTPFLDPKLAAFAYGLPDRLKIRGKTGKVLLRRWLARELPAARWDAPKSGFTVPVSEWITKSGGQLGPLVAAQPGIAEMCRPGAVAALYVSQDSKARVAAWRLLFYALWHHCHILQQPVAGDVFETLSLSSRHR